MFKVHEVFDTDKQKVVARCRNLQQAKKHALSLNDAHKMDIAWEAVHLSSKGGWKRPSITTKTKNEYGITVKTETPNPKHQLLVETLNKLKGERYTVNTYDLV